MDSVHPSTPGNCRITPPQGWVVEAYPGSIVVVRSADGEAFAVVEFITGPASQQPLCDIVGKGHFHSSSFFAKPKTPEVEPSSTESCAMGSVIYSTPKGASGRARLVCMKRGPSVVLFAYAAPEQLIAEIEQALYRIFEFAGNAAAPSADHPAPSPQPQFSHNTAATQPAAPPPPPAAHAPVAVQNASPAPQSPPAAAAPQHAVAPAQHQVPAPQPPPAPISYVQYTEQEKGTFVLEVPRGWQVKGGFSHPAPGDRRPWIEARSPDGIYIACDPTFPQNLCHFRDQMEGQLANTAAGTQLLNLNPSAQRVSDVYVANVAVRTFGALQPKKRLARPDMVDMLKSQLQEYRVPVTPKWLIAADELLFDCSRAGQPLVLSVLSVGAFNGEYIMGMWGFWEANVYIYIAPPQLAAQAEEVRAHMKRTIRITPKLMQIYQQDEAQIAANARMGHQAQLNWFSNQQAMHNMQTAVGDSIVNSYWSHNR